jgi:transposase
LRRGPFLTFFAKPPPTPQAPEACGGSHHRGHGMQAPGHEAVRIPPQYVRPFVKRGKNDRNWSTRCAATPPYGRRRPLKARLARP